MRRFVLHVEEIDSTEYWNSDDDEQHVLCGHDAPGGRSWWGRVLDTAPDQQTLLEQTIARNGALGANMREARDSERGANRRADAAEAELQEWKDAIAVVLMSHRRPPKLLSLDQLCGLQLRDPDEVHELKQECERLRAHCEQARRTLHLDNMGAREIALSCLNAALAGASAGPSQAPLVVKGTDTVDGRTCTVEGYVIGDVLHVCKVDFADAAPQEPAPPRDESAELAAWKYAGRYWLREYNRLARKHGEYVAPEGDAPAPDHAAFRALAERCYSQAQELAVAWKHDDEAYVDGKAHLLISMRELLSLCTEAREPTREPCPKRIAHGAHGCTLSAGHTEDCDPDLAEDQPQPAEDETEPCEACGARIDAEREPYTVTSEREFMCGTCVDEARSCEWKYAGGGRGKLPADDPYFATPFAHLHQPQPARPPLVSKTPDGYPRCEQCGHLEDSQHICNIDVVIKAMAERPRQGEPPDECAWCPGPVYGKRGDASVCLDCYDMGPPIGLPGKRATFTHAEAPAAIAHAVATEHATIVDETGKPRVELWVPSAALPDGWRIDTDHVAHGPHRMRVWPPDEYGGLTVEDGARNEMEVPAAVLRALLREPAPAATFTRAEAPAAEPGWCPNLPGSEAVTDLCTRLEQRAKEARCSPR